MTSERKSRNALSLRTYRAASGMMGPLADLTLKHRLKHGKEDPDRVNERRGIATIARPDGPLVWIHGASVGESLSILPLVARLSVLRRDLQFLVTSGTVTSARLMATRLPDNATHQFSPLDHPAYVRRFLDHWQPDAAMFVESELWPNLIQMTAARDIPMALVNGRISPKSYNSWKQRPDAIHALLSAFQVRMAQDTPNKERLAELSDGDVAMFGNLKMAAPALPVTQTDLSALEEQVRTRPRWLAASTHPGEEEYVLDAHTRVSERFPDLLTIIAPRHPERGEEIAGLIRARGLRVARRAAGEDITADTQVYLADTLGELGLFYRLSDVAFVGGSIVETGGHNPLEPARLRSAILYGPYTFNFTETYRDMRASGGTALVRNERDLAAALVRLLTDDMTRDAMADRARNWAEDNAEEVLINIVEALMPVLPAPHEPG
ncbi:3-deoxy-D-manno-octulosonic acid transferase [Parvularcula sp. IMCC14364]|uniref:3-deoxy-D-manno-octulosonic acid transferase n=1 Tax=Parvularcula sp. IMCC14364 TaxID=3067902 RepID=UPI0027424416|nr:3-deoxy-D-manno-octulosonic acid transferase [Parvularcula sp. IMCC14364]